MRFRPATDLDAQAWQDLLGACASGDFLHDWEWANVAAFDGQPQRRYVLQEGGQIVAIAAAQVRGLPLGRQFWYVPHGPVLDYGSAHATARLRAMVIGLREAARRHRAVTVRLEPRLEAGTSDLAAFAATRGLRPRPETLQVGDTRLVDLTDDEALIAGFDKDTRYAVRRAEREGVAVALAAEGASDAAIDSLHGLVGETQLRAGFTMPALARYRVAWRGLGQAGRAVILESRHEGELLAAAMVVFEGDRSFYLFSGSRREDRGEQKRYASYALQWAMMRLARERGCRVHDLWGVAPPDAGEQHAWHGVGLFKKGFGGRQVAWAGSWDLVVDAPMYRLREATGIMRRWVRGLRSVAGMRPGRG